MNPHRILVIDDDKVILWILKEWLELNGHLVTCAESVDEILWLSLWQWSGFDCIITGINQPGLDGIEFTQLVQTTEGPPVIVMSGFNPQTAEPRAIAAGAAAFLSKPFDLQELLKVIDAVYCRFKSAG